MNILKMVLAMVAGLIVAGVTVMCVEMIGHAIYPPPPGLDFTDRDTMAAYVATLPFAAFAFVGIAWILGAVIGGLVAAWLSPKSKPACAAVIGGFILVGAIVNLAMIPHPTWFAIAAPTLLLIAIAALVVYVANRRRPATA